MNSACDVAADELIAFTEEELPERRMRDLEAHVPSCPTCQERLTGVSETMSLLQNTIPRPTSQSRQEMLVKIDQEMERTTDQPHRSWFQVASLAAIGATFLIAAVMLWTGIGGILDSIPMPFQQASQDRSQEWVAQDDDAAARFDSAPLPRSIGADLPVYDWSVRSGIRVIVYQESDNGDISVEVSQFVVDDDVDAPGHMTEAGKVDGIPFLVDDPNMIQEVRWVDGDLAHHLQVRSRDNNNQAGLTLDDVEQIIQAFLEDDTRPR